MRRVLGNPALLATVGLAVGVLFVVLVRAQNSRDLLAPFDTEAGPFEIAVQIPFEPEAFHLARLQNAGRIVGVEGSTVHLRAVDRDQLRALAWYSWVDSIDPVGAQ